MKKYIDFVLVMTEKEIKVRYKRAIFGLFWIIINPLLLMAIMGLIFQYFVPVKVDNYFLFLFTGLLPWQFFSNSLNKATPSFYNERNLIKKSKFSKEVIVFSIVLSNLFHFLISIGLLIILLIGDKIFVEKYSLIMLLSYCIRMLWLIPAIIWLTIFTGMLSLLTATINVKFRDINFITQLFVSLLFYATPIVYTLDLLPNYFRPIFYLNPLTIIIEIFHNSLVNLQIDYIYLGIISFLITLIISWLAVKTYKRENGTFDDWL